MESRILTKLTKAALSEWLPGAGWGIDGGRGVGGCVGVNVLATGLSNMLNNELMVSMIPPTPPSR